MSVSFVVEDTAGSRASVDVAVTVAHAADPSAWGYRPPVPDGWLLVDGGRASVPATATRRYYRGCKLSGWLKDGAADLIFVDCDFTGGTWGTQGARIRHYGCRFGELVSDTQERDGMQWKPNTSGSPRPTDLLFQGCSVRNVTRTGGYHTDGIQFGGVLNPVVRWCYFDNVAVEMILFNSWNGTPEGGLVDRCYFGSRPDAGGPPVHFSGTSKNCRAVNNFYDGTVASIATTTSGCYVSGTRPRSAWTFGDPWETY